METITKQEAARKIRESNGKLFRVDFTKRSNGAPRRMIGRLGVQKGVTGEGLAFDPKSHNLIVVHEFVGQGQDAQGRHATSGTQFRMVPVERIEALRIFGEEFQVV